MSISSVIKAGILFLSKLYLKLKILFQIDESFSSMVLLKSSKFCKYSKGGITGPKAKI